jgi:hypothetical protein
MAKKKGRKSSLIIITSCNSDNVCDVMLASRYYLIKRLCSRGVLSQAWSTRTIHVC